MNRDPQGPSGSEALDMMVVRFPQGQYVDRDVCREQLGGLPNPRAHRRGPRDLGKGTKQHSWDLLGVQSSSPHVTYASTSLPSLLHG